MDKKELVWNAFNNKPVERVPVGFWFHYTENELISAYEKPEMRGQRFRRKQRDS